MGVVEVIAIRSEAEGGAKQKGLRRGHGHVAAGRDLLDVEAALAFVLGIGEPFAVTRNGRWIDDTAMIGELGDGDVAGIDRRRGLTRKFVETETCNRQQAKEARRAKPSSAAKRTSAELGPEWQ